MMAKPVVVFGVGDFARVAAHYLDVDSARDVVAFTVNERYMPDPPRLRGRPVVPFEALEASHPPADYDMLVAIGFSNVNRSRAEIFEQCRARGYGFVTYVNSRARHWGETQIGANTFIFEDNVIQPFVRIGDNVVLWSGNHIGHDTVIGDHVFVASHAVISGNCRIGDFCFIGVNATVRDAVTVAPRCVIGAGAVIMRDTQEGEVYAVRNTEVFPKKSWELKGL